MPRASWQKNAELIVWLVVLLIILAFFILPAIGWV